MDPSPVSDDDHSERASDWVVTRQLLESAIDITPSEREAYVRRSAASSDVAERVLELLALEAETRGESDLGEPLGDFLRSSSQSGGGQELERLGPWEVRRRLGRGGMADVWLAVRADGTYRRRVAIKKLHPGLADREVLARFERERQILANLSHPGIAKMLGAGTSSDGTPYLVMELIEGQRIDEYADERHLSLRERIQLVVSVADAVMAAHRMHVVHRDIKPSNILVDLEGRPTLLDFGVAKVLDPEKNAESLVTLDINRYLTPNYASPEQMRGQPLRGTSDVYSLAVLTFELLTGTPPLSLAQVSTADALELSRSAEPPHPAQAYLALANKDQIARLRGATPGQLGRALRNRDLEAVLEASLRKEAARRPPDAGAFRDELQRWLTGEPVLSQKDGQLRRAWRVIGRHRVVAALSVALVLATSIGFWSSWTEARRARRANASLVEQSQVAAARLNDLRASLRILLGDTVESLSGIPGTEHAVDRILRRGITIAERHEDPRLQTRLGEALIRKAEHSVRAHGPTPAVAEEMERGFKLVQEGFAAQNRGGNPGTAAFALDLASVRTRLGELVAAEKAVDLAARELGTFEPRSELQGLSAVITSTRVDLTRARVWERTGQFAAVESITSEALTRLAELRTKIAQADASGEARSTNQSTNQATARSINERADYLQGRISAMEGNLVGLRGVTGGLGPIDATVAQLLGTSRSVAQQHGANRVIDANSLTMRLTAALLLARHGELAESRAVFEECRASLPKIDAARPQTQELITSMAALGVRSELATRSNDMDELLSVAADAATLANIYELRLSPSFHRTESIADLILISGKIQRIYGEPASASTQLTRAYTLFDSLAEASPSHFYVAVGRCEAALSLHELLAAGGTEESDWLARAKAHYEALPGDDAAKAIIDELGQRVYAALSDRK